jgi:hypothetical protein
MSSTGSTRGEPGRARAVHRGPTAARTEGAKARWRAHRSTASSRSGALKLTSGGAIERGEHEELGSGLIGARAAAWRRDGAKKSQEARWGGVPAWERRRDGLGEVWGSPGGRQGGFYRARGGRRGGGRSNGGDE